MGPSINDTYGNQFSWPSGQRFFVYMWSIRNDNILERHIYLGLQIFRMIFWYLWTAPILLLCCAMLQDSEGDTPLHDVFTNVTPSGNQFSWSSGQGVFVYMWGIRNDNISERHIFRIANTIQNDILVFMDSSYIIAMMCYVAGLGGRYSITRCHFQEAWWYAFSFTWSSCRHHDHQQ